MQVSLARDEQISLEIFGLAELTEGVRLVRHVNVFIGVTDFLLKIGCLVLCRVFYN